MPSRREPQPSTALADEIRLTLSALAERMISFAEGEDLIGPEELTATAAGDIVFELSKRAARQRVARIEASGKKLGPKAVELRDVTRRAIREQRESQELRQADLAERMGDLGYAFGQTTVSDIEKGSRRLTIEELLGVAHALSLAPVELIADARPGEVVALTESFRCSNETLRKMWEGKQ